MQNNEGKVYKLKKALYGLRQAPRAWYSTVDKYFIQHGFQRSESEPTLYIRLHGDFEILLVCLYVDDIIYMGNSQSMVNESKLEMMCAFEMSDLGLLQYFLELEIYESEH